MLLLTNKPVRLISNASGCTFEILFAFRFSWYSDVSLERPWMSSIWFASALNCYKLAISAMSSKLVSWLFATSRCVSIRICLSPFSSFRRSLFSEICVTNNKVLKKSTFLITNLSIHTSVRVFYLDKSKLVGSSLPEPQPTLKYFSFGNCF